MNDTLGTVHHEAGHAVVLAVLEYPFEYVTVVPDADENRAGGVKWDPPKRSDVYFTDRADKALTALYAGSGAEARFLDVEFEDVWNSTYSFPDRVDAIRIARAMEDIRQLPLALFTSIARSKAVDLVNTHWEVVEAVVPPLLARGTLSEAEVRALMGVSGPSRA
jgi:hypothetical protein